VDWSRWSGTTTMWDRNTSTDKGRFLPFVTRNVTPIYCNDRCGKLFGMADGLH